MAYNSRFMNDNRFIIFNGSGDNGLQCFTLSFLSSVSGERAPGKRNHSPHMLASNAFQFYFKGFDNVLKVWQIKSVQITGWSSACIETFRNWKINVRIDCARGAWSKLFSGQNMLAFSDLNHDYHPAKEHFLWLSKSTKKHYMSI